MYINLYHFLCLEPHWMNRYRHATALETPVPSAYPIVEKTLRLNFSVFFQGPKSVYNSLDNEIVNSSFLLFLRNLLRLELLTLENNVKSAGVFFSFLSLRQVIYSASLPEEA